MSNSVFIFESNFLPGFSYICTPYPEQYQSIQVAAFVKDSWPSGTAFVRGQPLPTPLPYLFFLLYQMFQLDNPGSEDHLELYDEAEVETPTSDITKERWFFGAVGCERAAQKPAIKAQISGLETISSFSGFSGVSLYSR
jgi:hypothetical protein